MNSQNQYLRMKSLVIPGCLFFFMILVCNPAIAQEQPPKPIQVTVSTLQNLSFGSFIQSGTSGTVTVTPDGLRTASGNLILPNMSSNVSAALFDVEALPGTLITILTGPDTQLSGTNGGFIFLTVGLSNTGSPFIATSSHTDVFIGGTLTVGALLANPAGAYSGSFQVTFIQQ
ncbi:MAG TPA: DUF4402 domain-containing protein [Prolixibacteraceae bacterium]|nr:DUF4402 domain-containing protein [Prolixibacteraceae bacterium]